MRENPAHNSRQYFLQTKSVFIYFNYQTFTVTTQTKMKKIKIISLILSTLTFASCTQNLIQPDLGTSNSETTVRKKVQGDGKHDLLGWGYDPTVGYLAPEKYNQLQVIDVDRLQAEQPGDFFHGQPNVNLSEIIAGNNAVDWSEDLTSKFSGSATKVLTLSMHQDVTQNNFISAKYSYATYFMTINLQRETLHHSIDVLKNYLTPTFTTAINTLSANEIIKRYGTHVFTDITIGGKLEVNYRSYANSSSQKTTVNSGISVGIDKVFSLSADNSVGFSYKSSNLNARCTYKTIGGDPTKCIFGEITDTTTSQKVNLDKWAASVSLSNAEIVDIGDGSLIPIYEFVSDAAKKETLKQAITNYLNSKLVNTVNGSILCSFGLNTSNDRIVSLDYNGDGIKDILCYSPGYGIVSLNAGLQDGAFYNIFTSSNGLGGYDLKSTGDQVIAFDYDGDGKDDLMFYRPGPGIVFVLKSNGDGTFTTVYAPAAGVGIGQYNFKSSSDRAIALDYDGDGKDDLMCYRPGSGIVFVIKSNGNGTFTPIYAPAAHVGIGGFDFNSTSDKAIAFDYNGDGYEDILTYRPGSKVVYITKSNGDGTFTNVYASSNGIGGFDFSNGNDLVISLNYNGDKYSDLLCYRPGSKTVTLLKSNGNTSFASVMQSNNGFADFDLSNSKDKIISIDYNNDKLSDLILYRPGAGIAVSERSNYGIGNFIKDYPN
jgi:MAC/Perforin domain.